MSDQRGTFCRLQLTSDRAKTKKRLRELVGRVAREVRLLELRDADEIRLIGTLSLVEAARLLIGALYTIRHFLKQDPESMHRIGYEAGVTLNSADEAAVGFPAKPEITLDAEGIMQPPAGETLIRCGVCHCASFYITMPETEQHDSPPARWACTKCGAETKLHRIYHAGGQA